MWVNVLLLYLASGVKQKTNGQLTGTNIALNKPASQFPKTYCDPNICYNASLAVDGEVDESYNLHGHCSHTNVQYSSFASWTIDFLGSYYIDRVLVHNRKPVRYSDDIIGSRLRGFTLYGLTEDQTIERSLFTYRYDFVNNEYPIVVDIEVPKNSYYSGIKIDIPYRGQTEPTILTLCEVEVFSVLCKTHPSDLNRLVTYTDNLNDGSRAIFACTTGYYLSGNSTLLCKEGKWIEDAPICKEVMCPYVAVFQNGKYDIVTETCSARQIDKSLLVNCSIKPSCDKGYSLKNGTTRVCSENGTWNGYSPMCVAASVPSQDREENRRMKYIVIVGGIVSAAFVVLVLLIVLLNRRRLCVMKSTSTEERYADVNSRANMSSITDADHQEIQYIKKSRSTTASTDKHQVNVDHIIPSVSVYCNPAIRNSTDFPEASKVESRNKTRWLKELFDFSRENAEKTI